MKHEMYRDYEQGMDIACIASKYNLSCEEARELLGVEEENDNEDTEKYEEICRALVGIDATERYTHEDILSYVYNLKKTEEKFYDNKK